MRLPSLLAAGIAAGAAWASAASGAACSVDGPPPHRIEANPADQTPPSRPTVRITDKKRGRHGACSGGGDCSDLSSVSFRVEASDDVSPPSEIGYLLDAGDIEFAGDRPLSVEPSGTIAVHTFGEEWDGRDFEVRVFAVDRAGNVSEEWTAVTVRFSERCQVAADFVDGSLWTLAMLTLLLRSQRRRTLATEA